MTGMDGKKDPGKFTVRFNLRDPQQRQAAELLNQQGRSKAQFLTSAVLSYVKGESATPPHPSAGLNRSEVERIVMEILGRQQARVPSNANEAAPVKTPNADCPGGLADTDMDSIRATLEAFHST